MNTWEQQREIQANIANVGLLVLRWLYFAGSVRKVGSLSSLTSVIRSLSTGVEGNLRVPGR